MRAVLADLAIESEAATALAIRLAGAVDRSARGEESERGFARLATAIGKYWVCKRTPTAVGEALECLGGNGYVEESGLPRLYREAPLNSLWEGSGNVQALDVLRALARTPDAVEVFLAEVDKARGGDPRLDAATKELRAAAGSADEGQARRISERMALVLQGSLLVRHAPAAVADAFCGSRLGGDWGHAFGTLPSGSATDAIVGRAAPRSA
jgi:putative acyl-CoA dehydrogenase